MTKNNIIDILKNCPQGMELDCTCADNVVFDKIIEYEQIKCVIGECREPLILDKYGRLLHICCPKCVIFPKGKTTWEGFVPPCKFKDGDVIFTLIGCPKDDKIYPNILNWLSIFKEERNGGCATYVDYSEDGKYYNDRENKPLLCLNNNIIKQRLATEEEKERLFNVIKANGRRWNPCTKKMEKLPRFKVGDRIQYNNECPIRIIKSLDYDRYKLDNGCYINFGDEDAYKLLKFDITTLKPFDKVLVRDFDNETWEINFFSRLRDEKHFKCLDLSYVQCIPYEGNEHLLGTTNDCDEYYKK